MESRRQKGRAAGSQGFAMRRNRKAGRIAARKIDGYKGIFSCHGYERFFDAGGFAVGTTERMIEESSAS